MAFPSDIDQQSILHKSALSVYTCICTQKNSIHQHTCVFLTADCMSSRSAARSALQEVSSAQADKKDTTWCMSVIDPESTIEDDLVLNV